MANGHPCNRMCTGGRISCCNCWRLGQTTSHQYENERPADAGKGSQTWNTNCFFPHRCCLSAIIIQNVLILFLPYIYFYVQVRMFLPERECNKVLPDWFLEWQNNREINCPILEFTKDEWMGRLGKREDCAYTGIYTKWDGCHWSYEILTGVHQRMFPMVWVSTTVNLSLRIWGIYNI